MAPDRLNAIAAAHVADVHQGRNYEAAALSMLEPVPGQQVRGAVEDDLIERYYQTLPVGAKQVVERLQTIGSGGLVTEDDTARSGLTRFLRRR